MKHKCMLFVSLAVIALTFAACSKDESSSPTTPTNTTNTTTKPKLGSMSAKINGIAWTAGSILGPDDDPVTVSFSSDGKLVTFYGTLFGMSGMDGIYMTVTNPGVGDFELSKLGADTYAYYATISPSAKNYYIDETNKGTLHITTFDTSKKTMSGTFSFTATDHTKTYSITDGKFEGNWK